MATIGQTPRTASPHGGANIPKVLGYIGLACVCIAAILAYFLSVKTDPVFYLWIFGLVAEFAAGIWAIARRLLR
jgi:hypothetical protein